MQTTPNFKFDFSSHIAIVTGASKGIGAGIARCFADSGASVAIHYFTHPQEAEGLAASINERGGKAITVQADLSNPRQVDEMFHQVEKRLGVADILVNNAGIYPVTTILDMTEENWDSVIDINLKGVFLCTQRFARALMGAHKAGSIVNIDSIEALHSAYGHSHYDASKAGVMMFTKEAAMEFGKQGIRVNAVGPGLINAPGLDTSWPDGVARWMKRVPLERLGEPEDVGNACLFLASDAASFITGVHLIVDGGVLANEVF